MRVSWRFQTPDHLGLVGQGHLNKSKGSSTPGGAGRRNPDGIIPDHRGVVQNPLAIGALPVQNQRGWWCRRRWQSSHRPSRLAVRNNPRAALNFTWQPGQPGN